jgi:hypothetical protein
MKTGIPDLPQVDETYPAVAAITMALRDRGLWKDGKGGDWSNMRRVR